MGPTWARGSRSKDHLVQDSRAVASHINCVMSQRKGIWGPDRMGQRALSYLASLSLYIHSFNLISCLVNAKITFS